MYWFGKDLQLNEKPWLASESWALIRSKQRGFASTSVDAIVNLLHDFSHEWRVDGPLYKLAVPKLVEESGFTEQEVKSTLAILPDLLKREGLERRLRAEFSPLEQLDSFTKTPHFPGRVRALPLGIILHVTAGNVFLSSIDSLIMGLLTKNISLVKVSSQNTFFPLFFARALRDFDQKMIVADKLAILHWKGGDQEVESVLKNQVNAIIAWGGEEMIDSYRKDLPRGVKFLDFGPKVSFQVISSKGIEGQDLDKVAERIVSDIIPWNQGACASPQNLYLQKDLNAESLLEAIDRAFKNAPPRPDVSADEAVEIWKERFRGYYSELMEGGSLFAEKEHLVHLEANKLLKPSPLNRSLIVKRFNDADDLFGSISPFSYYVQSCSYLFSDEERDAYLETLGLAGVKRFAPLGSITWGMEGAPHDGRFVLRELVQFIGDEQRVMGVPDSRLPLSSSSDLKRTFKELPHPKGFVFSSGGTTGEPKFVHFSYEEFDQITDILALNFRIQGIRSGMMVANLFVAGNLWSSFTAVEKALEKIGAVQLPIGGLSQSENVVSYLNRFRPEAVLGIPSLLLKHAETALALKIELNVPMIFYAGEALSESRQNFLRTSWKTTYFGSAGYASVDAGIIGYQCLHSKPGEHHLYSDLVSLEIINEEAVVTSLYRTSMPIKRYRTGDRVEWIENCSCGRKDPRFKLLGRIDNIIQIWSCRLQLEDIERSIRQIHPQITTYQVVLDEQVRGDGVRERLRLFIEGHVVDANGLVKAIYENSRDLKDTLSLKQYEELISIELVEEVARNPRTGKISVILDCRH